MCKIAFVGSGPGVFDCKNRGELAKALGESPIYKTANTARPSDCLCDLDAAKTAEALGVELLTGPEDWIVRFSGPKKVG